jgi:5-methylcytosine-specific restriction protein A
MAKPKIQTLKPRIAAANTSRCQTMAGGWRTSEMTAAQRGYDYRWQKARADYLSRNPLCVMCKARGVVTLATVVNHIEPHRGDQHLFWSEENWESLCKRHHDSDAQKRDNQSPHR